MTRPLPANHDLEAQALAAVLIDPETWPELAPLPTEAFHNPAYRDLHGVFTELRAAGLPLDDVTLILQRAQETGRGTFLNLAFLTGLMTRETSAYYAPHYAAELRALHARRETIKAAHRVIQHATEGDLTSTELAELASQVPAPLDNRSRQGFISHAHAIQDALTTIENPVQNVIRTGLHDLDDVMLGFEPGALYILAARPAMGKSGLGYQFVIHAAKRGHHAAVGSLEMPARDLATRALATNASVNLSAIRHRTLSGPERERLKVAGARLRDLPITFMDSTDQTLHSIALDARKLRAAGQLDFLMIDYLQLIESGKGGSENRVQEVSIISRGLKKLAMELDIPVLALSQLSRAVESRPNKRPLLSDLRESGSVEQDADTVMFIYRDEYYNKNTDQQGVAEIIIGKQRRGPVDTVKVSYSAEFVRFSSLSLGVISSAAD